ncbi:HNH endonuclease [Streptomyces anulatus]|uniref:HNH endonuclease n=1 Tax=Streptomyces anulatus TaxID=1892 RepID=UPI001C5D2586|nr:HNH endonuclease signature motif containing protein [Streptomyces anulatus]QYA92465.1 HNH endonuclease [Streptomyces anulatus]
MTGQETLSRGRGNQPLWVWLMVLTAHGGRCVYCDERPSQTLEHEAPLASETGRDIWWNLVPACDRCNGWKHKKSATAWAFDMKMHHAHPKAGFARNALPLHVVEGIKERIARVQREIQDAARRVWFEHHYGDMRTPRLRSEKHGEVDRCAEKLKSYLYPPWESPEGRQSDHTCTRVLCCGHTQRESCLTFITLPNPDREALKNMAYARGLWVGDLLGALVKPALEEWGRSQATDDGTS